MRKLIWTAIVILAAAGIYFSGLYTYFIKSKVSEELPQMNANQNEVAAGPKILKQGDFVDADFLHKGSGKAYILEYADGKKILRFENFETVNGPDLYVYLSKTTNPTGDIESLGAYIDLGRLKGNIGDQNYELPKNIIAETYSSAVIWCKKFGVLFPYAVLK